MSEIGRFQGQVVEEGDDGDSGLLFYRCCLCGGVINKWDVREVRGCPKCAHPRMRPTNLSFVEKIVQIFKHPKVWAWNK